MVSIIKNIISQKTFINLPIGEVYKAITSADYTKSDFIRSFSILLKIDKAILTSILNYSKYKQREYTMRNFSLKQIGLWGMLFVIALSGCQCDKKPTEPEPVETENPIYFYNRSSEQRLFKYLPSTQTMDSTIIQWSPLRITVSADNKLLYLVLPLSVVVIATDNYEFVRELPYATYSNGGVSVSNDNKLIAITGDTLRIIRTSDYKVIYADSSNRTYRGTFSHDNSAFYCSYIDSLNSSAVYKLELNSPNYIKTTKSFENNGANLILPTHDEKKWIIYAGIKFFVYEVARDSMIFEGFVYPGSGTAVLSPDSKKVYLTGPGSGYGNVENIPPYIRVFDIENNIIEKNIDSTLFYGDSSDWANPNDIVITNDNKYLGVLGGTLSLHRFHLIDLETLTVADKREYGLLGYSFIPMTYSNVK